MSDDNKPKKGGDMKSIKHSGLKNGSFLSLCVPSSAAVERVFSLLKLCKATNKTEILHDELEGSMLMRVNDVHA